ncbi:hypothetical protein M011DRAFT_473890 [Sporormia fimetaria CBS 119925]|uniref:Heterokaryon incompatibility domain-containing protein n=1 Tax=Sporormia fimetaria CBS 119925 TaxID=1340428 RepID=A0A6A6VNU2_9PLEO|nr:hypothetical protein M011DRAFT_473890 [Sporormia fimetaria CBS 119925]
MEYDVSKTFETIHGSLDDFVSQMNKIEEALVYTPEDPSDFPIRLVALYEEKNEAEDAERDVVNLRVTSMDEHDTSTTYIAVSYTWKQPAALASEMGIPSLPEYRIWTSEKEWRPPHCTALMLYRTFCFARTYGVEKPMLWIDQECIKQSSQTDVEYHLQRMHLIYGRSMATVGILTHVTSHPNRRVLERLVKPRDVGWPGGHTWEIIELEMIEAADWFVDIADPDNNPYLKRTWVLQERLVSRNFHYLVPLRWSHWNLDQEPASGTYSAVTPHIASEPPSNIVLGPEFWDSGGFNTQTETMDYALPFPPSEQAAQWHVLWNSGGFNTRTETGELDLGMTFITSNV